ncbi:MAG: hypothetical protein WB608_10760 [Terracidiphilus sp.]
MKILGLALLLAMATAIGSLSGKWEGSFRVAGGEHEVPQLFVLHEDGNKLTGTGGPDTVERYPIANGQVKGDRVSFELTTGDWKFFYDLKNTGQQMSGQLTLKSVNATRTAEVSLRKSE